MAKPAKTSKIYKAWWPRALEVASQDTPPNFVELGKEWKVTPLTARDRYIRARIETTKRTFVSLEERRDASASASDYLRLLGAQVDELSESVKDSLAFLTASAVKMTPEVKPKSRLPPPALWQWVISEIAEALTVKGAAAAIGTDHILVEGWIKGRTPSLEHRRRIRLCFASIWGREDFLDSEEMQKHLDGVVTAAAAAVVGSD